MRALKTTAILALSALLATQVHAQTKKQDPPIHEIRVYQTANADQAGRLDAYLAECLIPALHRLGVQDVGVFKPLPGDTVYAGRTYMLTSHGSLRKLISTEERLMQDATYLAAAKSYLDTFPAQQTYTRKETIILQAFRLFPMLRRPSLKGARTERIYELRSYESLNERLYWNKVEMFNEGGEIRLFDRLGFNAVFYGEVVAGARMPNLMYMTTFENKADRDAHWQSFRDDPEWKMLSADPKYRKNVSRNETIFLRPTSYSDY
ncbi:MAG: NIPSNAP family protein [Chitinophagaceae bacterium]|nr:NIPSNAP family protein [Chitinophagaceae bacterium]